MTERPKISVIVDHETLNKITELQIETGNFSKSSVAFDLIKKGLLYEKLMKEQEVS